MGCEIDVARQEVWRRRLERFAGWSGTAAAFCRREGVTPASFYLWRKRLAQGVGLGRGVATPDVRDAMRPSDDSRRGRASFVELSLTGTAWVEIELPNGVVVRVPAEREATLRVAIGAAGQWGTVGRNAPSQEVPS